MTAWELLVIGLALPLIWIVLIKSRKLIIGTGEGNAKEWYRMIIYDLPIIVAAFLIVSITIFIMYAYYKSYNYPGIDIKIVESFVESTDAFATGVWGFLVGFGSGRAFGTGQASIGEALEALGKTESRDIETKFTLLENERNELRADLQEAQETISRLTRNNGNDGNHAEDSDSEETEESIEAEEIAETREAHEE